MNLEVFACSSGLGLARWLALVSRQGESRAIVKRLLIVAITSPQPEVEDWWSDHAVLREAAAEVFDHVVMLNDELAPFHPLEPKQERRWRALRARWLERAGARHVDALHLEAVCSALSLLLAALFDEAPLTVYAEGLEVHAPTSAETPVEVARRVRTVGHLDLVPGALPLLLDEWAVQRQSESIEALRPILQRWKGSVGPLGLAPGSAVFLGQHFARRGLLAREAEIELYVDGLLRLRRCAGAAEVVFRPHPCAEPSSTREVARRYRVLTGRPLGLLAASLPVEALLLGESVAAVAAVSSIALLTVSRLAAVPAFAHRCKDLYAALAPGSRDRRLAAMLVDVALPSLGDLERASRQPAGEPWPAVARSVVDAQRLAPERVARLHLAVAGQLHPGLTAAPRSGGTAPALEPRDDERLTFYVQSAGLDATGPRSASAIVGRAVAEVVDAAAARFLGPRKLEKLRATPERFFGDSTRPWVRGAGRVYLRLTAPGPARPGSGRVREAAPSPNIAQGSGDGSGRAAGSHRSRQRLAR